MRRLARSLGAGILGLACLVIAVPAPAAHADQPIDGSDRASVISSYRSWLEPLLSIPTGWNGNLGQCRAGEPSAESQDAVLSSVNYMRALANLPAVAMNPRLSAKSQEAALIMAAGEVISHDLPRSATCWSKAGDDGARNGNLALGIGYPAGALASTTGPRAVLSYMEDAGASNDVVGHRRWLMYQSLAEIGNGDTDTSNSIYVMGDRRRGTTPAWVAWPTPGYFPRELEPSGRWSLSHPKADFRRAKVEVTTPEGPLRVSIAPIRNGFGDNTISWDMALPSGFAIDPAADYPITVRVTGIRMGKKKVAREWTTTLVPAATQ